MPSYIRSLLFAIAFSSSCTGQVIAPQTSDQITTLELVASIRVVVVGREIVLTANAKDAAGLPVEETTSYWTSSDPSILSIDDTGVGIAIAVGGADVQVQIGGLTSNSVSIQVLENTNLVVPSVRLTPESIGLKVGGSLSLNAQARNEFSEIVSDPKLTYSVNPQGVASIDASGTVVGLAPGSAQLFASFQGQQSLAAVVQVVDAEIYPAVHWVEPSSDTSQLNTIHVVAQTHTLAVGSFGNSGLPVAATSARLLADGLEIGTLTIGSGTAFGSVFGDVLIDSLSLGDHELTIEATWGGTTVASSPRILKHEVLNTAWQDMTAGLGIANDVAISVNGDEIMLLATECKRECQTRAFLWDQEATQWQVLNYNWRLWRQDGVDPNFTYTSILVDYASLVPVAFVGWGWPSTLTRDLEAPSNVGRVVAYSTREARTAFNVADGSRRYWYDCYAASWDPSGGFDGAGGWSLLGDNLAYLYDAPNPGIVGWERGIWEFPAGAESNRTDDCVSPQLAYDGQNRLTMAYMSSTVPVTNWGVELTRWDGSAWTPFGQRLDVPLDGASITEFLLDPTARAVVTVSNEDTRQVYRMKADGTWSSLEDGTLGIEDLSLGEAGSLFGAARNDGDLRVFSGADGQWAALGGVLDGQPWAPVHEVSLLRSGDHLIVAWSQGPSDGNQNIYVAQWIREEARWQPVGEGAVDTLADKNAHQIDLAVDADGHLLLAYLEPDSADNGLFKIRVRRSVNPVVTP